LGSELEYEVPLADAGIPHERPLYRMCRAGVALPQQKCCAGATLESRPDFR